MWFAKLFGGREELEDTDEPARFAAPEIARSSQTGAHGAVSAGKVSAGPAKPAGKKGFDPYNSGSFGRRNAWERIVRR